MVLWPEVYDLVVSRESLIDGNDGDLIPPEQTRIIYKRAANQRNHQQDVKDQRAEKTCRPLDRLFLFEESVFCPVLLQLFLDDRFAGRMEGCPS